MTLYRRLKPHKNLGSMIHYSSIHFRGQKHQADDIYIYIQQWYVLRSLGVASVAPYSEGISDTPGSTSLNLSIYQVDQSG